MNSLMLGVPIDSHVSLQREFFNRIKQILSVLELQYAIFGLHYLKCNFCLD